MSGQLPAYRWEFCFAWFPVRLITGGWAWLQTVACVTVYYWHSHENFYGPKHLALTQPQNWPGRGPGTVKEQVGAEL